MSNRYKIQLKNVTTPHNNVLIRSGEAPGIGRSRNMLYSGFNTLPRSVFWLADFNGRSDNTDVIWLKLMAINSIQFSVRSLLLVIALSAAAIHFWPKNTIEPPDEKWSELFSGRSPLANHPTIVPIPAGSNASVFRVTAKNTGNTVIQYSAYGPERISLYQETDANGKWVMSNWSWCGTGRCLFEIAPQESVELEVECWDDQKRERMLAMFNEKGTNRRGLVVLLEEPEEE